MARIATSLTALAVLLAGCNSSSTADRTIPRASFRPASAPVPSDTRFSAARAYAIAKLQVDLGPRPAGSAAQRRAATLLRRRLPRARFERVPGGLRNIVAGLPGREPAVVVGAHYDTTPNAGYLGANNSAAGVGAVVELARVLRHDHAGPKARAIRFVLFDGEEAPAGFQDFYAEGVRGSKAYVSAHRASTRELILLDFIAQRGVRFAHEAGSDPRLWGRLRKAARRVGVGSIFPDVERGEILDDHTPFTRAGIAAIDLIDFDYPCWQKTCDDLSQLSRPSLAASGSAVLALVEAESGRRRRR